MKPNISEFSYGYALTEELVHHHYGGVTASPYFPSLFDEGHLGFDLQLDVPGTPIFLQFKLSHWMCRDNCNEISKNALFPTGTHFFRMYLHARKHSLQHQLLLDLEYAGEDVHYVAPAFHRPIELDHAYRNHSVRTSSVFIKPSAIGPLPDDKEHHVSFVLNGPRHFCSDPRDIDQDLSFESFNRNLQTLSEKAGREPLRNRVSQVTDSMLSLLKARKPVRPKDLAFKELSDRIDAADAVAAELGPIKTLPYIASTFLGAQVLVLRRG